MTITEMHHVTAGMLSQKPHQGPKVGRPPKSAIARAASRWHVDEKSVLAVRCASDKVFPGQYYDQETNLHYNYFRDYDPMTGRYVESDPIGLTGGLNTYTYVSANPIEYNDIYGLFNIVGTVGGSYVLGIGGEGYVGAYLTLQWAPNFIDIGVLASGGLGIGYNQSLSGEVGYINGNENDINGISYNVNAGITPGGGTLMLDENGNLLGGTIGFAEEKGLSVSYVHTGATGLNDLGEWLGLWLYNKLHQQTETCP